MSRLSIEGKGLDETRGGDVRLGFERWLQVFWGGVDGLLMIFFVSPWTALRLWFLGPFVHALLQWFEASDPRLNSGRMQDNILARYLQHHQSNTAHVLCTRLVPSVDATHDGRGTVVVHVVVKRAVSCAEALLLEEEGVVEEGECVEHVEASLWVLACLSSPARVYYAPSLTESTHPSSAS